MPRFFIETVNGTFSSRDDGADYPDLADARRAAIEAASGIACDELSAAKPSIVVEACVQDEGGENVVRLAVAMCVGDLRLADRG